MLLNVSWRNIWRNPKRTLVILTAVVIGAWSMIFFGAISRGMTASMLSTSLNTLTGHIQIQKPAYQDDPVVENRLNDPEAVRSVLDAQLPGNAQWAFRIQVGGVAANARNAQSVSIVGIDPEKEPALSFYGQALDQGSLLAEDDPHGIVVGKALAESFDTRIGRKLVLMTQSADRETASRAFKIKGIYRAELEATEKRHVFVTLNAAQRLLGIGTDVTNACIRLPDLDQVEEVTHGLNTQMPPGVSAVSWTGLLPLLKGYLSMFDSFMLLWYVVVFVAMAFGLVNTMLMAVLERTREFGLLKALGMKPAWIVRGVLTECVMLLFIGLAAGNLLGLTTIQALSNGINLGFLSKGSQYFGMGHIIVPIITLKDIMAVNSVILVLGVLVCLYPALKAACITPVKAMTQI